MIDNNLKEHLEYLKFYFAIEVNGITTYTREVAPGYCHEIVCFPNGMIELTHYQHGRVLYIHRNHIVAANLPLLVSVLL